MKKKYLNNIHNKGDAVIDKGISLFETGTAPYPNYTNLTFYPTREDTRFYQAGRDGDVEIEAFRLKNEELYKKDPLYQLRLNLMAPETDAIKAYSNKSTRDMLEEITKAKYKKLLEEKKYFENIPEKFHPLIRRILEQKRISPKEGNAVAEEIDNAVKMGQVSDVMGRQIRRMIETQTEVERQFTEDDERRIVADLSLARERILNRLRRDRQFFGKSEDYLGAIADGGLKDALDVFNASQLTRDLGNLERAGYQASRNRHIINSENLLNFPDQEIVGQDADNELLGGAVSYPRTRNAGGEGLDFGRRGRGVVDIWAEQDENTGGTLLPDGYNIRPGPTFEGPDEIDEYTGLRGQRREIMDLREMGELGLRLFRDAGEGLENPLENYIQIIEDGRDGTSRRRGGRFGGAMTEEETRRLERQRERMPDLTPDELNFRRLFQPREETPTERRERGRPGAISMINTGQVVGRENFFRRGGFLQ